MLALYKGSPENLERETLREVLHKQLAVVEQLAKYTADETQALPVRVICVLMHGQCAQVPPVALQSLLIAWHYYYSADARPAARASRELAERAQTPEFSYLLSLQEFYSDSVPESLRAAWTQALDDIKFSDSFISWKEQQEAELLEDGEVTPHSEKYGYTAQLKAFIEKSTLNLPPDRASQIRENILNGEKRRCAHAVYKNFGIHVSPETIDLQGFTLQSYAPSSAGRKAKEEISDNLLQRGWKVITHEILLPLVQKTQEGLSAYTPVEETIRSPRLVKAVFALHSLSGYARGCAGVCVASDNPEENRAVKKNLWEMEEYLQLMYVDPASLRCVGVTMLHDYTVDGKRYLCASMNPSSTFLYQVDGAQLFHETLKVLISFAQDNGFDAIVMSRNPGIRTNRTGTFVQAMVQHISAIDQQVHFSPARIFSFAPSYMLNTMDVLWSKSI